jgi:hypothetical protein
MPANNTIVAFYGNSTSCRRYRLDAVDWAAAQNAPDKALWSLLHKDLLPTIPHTQRSRRWSVTIL